MLTGADLVLLTPWGEVTARAGRSGWRPRRDEHGGAPELLWPDGETRLGGRSAWTLRLHADGRVRGVLVAFEVTPAARPWLELCRTLLLSAALQRSAEARHGSSALSALLAEWLAGPQAALMLEPRPAAAGIGGESPYLVAVGEVGRGCALEAARRASSTSSSSARGRRGVLPRLGYGVLRDEAHHCVWVFASAAPRQHARLLMSGPERRWAPTRSCMGLSLPREDSPASRTPTTRRCRPAVAPGGSGLAWFDELDPVYWVLQQQPHGNLVALRDRLVGAIKQADPQGKLWRTLVAYIRSPDDLQALAAELHVHVNTLRYRLKRIEELVHEPLSRPETVAKLYLALQIDAMLERGGSAGRVSRPTETRKAAAARVYSCQMTHSSGEGSRQPADGLLAGLPVRCWVPAPWVPASPNCCCRRAPTYHGGPAGRRPNARPQPAERHVRDAQRQGAHRATPAPSCASPRPRMSRRGRQSLDLRGRTRAARAQTGALPRVEEVAPGARLATNTSTLSVTR